MNHLATSGITSSISPRSVSRRESALSSLALAEAAANRITPIWDIHSSVAVNPFYNLRHLPFFSALMLQQAATHSRLLPERAFFKEQYENGRIQPADLTFAINHARLSKMKIEASEWNSNSLVRALDRSDSSFDQFWCFTDLYDHQLKQQISSRIVREVSKWLSAYFDRGQALLSFPAKNVSVYRSWRALVEYDQTLDRLGLPLQRIIKQLPSDAEGALSVMAQVVSERVTISDEQWINYFHRLLASVLGWASYAQHFAFEVNRGHNHKALENRNLVLEILTIRMAYDLAVLSVLSDHTAITSRLRLSDLAIESHSVEYVWLLALERSYRKQLLERIRPAIPSLETRDRFAAQLVFCIDVRSELVRRHIEQTNPRIETLGFAGFFGLPITIQHLGDQRPQQQCPVLLEPSLHVKESSKGKESISRRLHLEKEQALALSRIRSGLTSCFSFAETLWLPSFKKMIQQLVPYSLRQCFKNETGTTRTPSEYDLSTWTEETKLSVAYSVLKHMSRLDNFAPFVIFFGHESESVNNPLASSLDCGACCGHSGWSNSVILAQLLNDKNVRTQLANIHGVLIPEETIFLSGIHNTTRGMLSIDLPTGVGKEELPALKDIEHTLLEAGHLAQEEMLTLLTAHQRNDLPDSVQLEARATDWSEVRPEWGLAKNASFIIGRRSRTWGIDLGGRSFLHDYDPLLDIDGSVLELILTAPMIVTNWINLQYYASTVAPTTFGAGDKTLHTVTSGIGIAEGATGDLAIGLSRQSVHVLNKYFHEPIRLQVVVEASRDTLDRIMKKHKVVRDLIANQWLHLISIDPATDETSLYESQGWLVL